MQSPSGGRVFRDPVHDIIDWKAEGDLGRLVCELVDCPEVQRLRHVRQLGMAALVFHGAEHSRFAHSMGVAHVARRMGHRLGLRDDRDEIVDGVTLRMPLSTVVAAALLHDLGHGPFSHVMERALDYHHEAYSEAILLDPSSRVHRVLSRVDGALPRQVADHVAGRVHGATRAIISSQFDADRADYLLRDARMTGVAVGAYDLERILLLLDRDEDGLVIGWGAYESLEGYLMARYHMYRLVYFHRAVRAAEGMLRSLFDRARWLLANGDRELDDGGVLVKMLRGETVEPGAWSRLGDFHAWSLVARWRDHGDRVLSELAEGLLERRLFRSLEFEGVPDTEAERVRAEIEDVLSPAERFYFFVDDARDVPYRPYEARDGRATKALRIRDRDRRIHAIEAYSPVVRALGESAYRLRRWCVHPALLPKVKPVLDQLRDLRGT